MIVSFRHKGLRMLFEQDNGSKVAAGQIYRLRIILSALDNAQTVKDMDQPTFRLHRLKGDLSDFWSVTVRANWRVIFRFSGQYVSDVDLVDYH